MLFSLYYIFLLQQQSKNIKINIKVIHFIYNIQYKLLINPANIYITNQINNLLLLLSA